MTRMLIRCFVRDPEQVYDAGVRQQYGRLAGVVGVSMNVVLFLIKLLAGLMTASVAIVADAFNNLSDAGTAIVTLAGFYLAGQEADEEHPFGHGRAEDLAGLVVSMAIFLVGFELGKTSVGKIIHPETVSFSWMSTMILAAAVLVKLWLCGFYRTLGKCMDSGTMRAAAADSLVDSAATALVLVSGLIGYWFDLQVDGYVGILIAFFILKAGWQAAKETLDPLLGRPMDPELAEDINRLVLDHPYILGIHDLVYHDYGPGRAMMSFHAEVPADEDLLAIHDVIDHIERELKQRNHIETVIHMDPVVQDEATERLRAQVEQEVKKIFSGLSIHDFRITAGPLHTNLIFDVMAPYDLGLTDSQLKEELSGRIRGLSEKYYAVIQVDRPYVEGICSKTEGDRDPGR